MSKFSRCDQLSFEALQSNTQKSVESCARKMARKIPSFLRGAGTEKTQFQDLSEKFTRFERVFDDREFSKFSPKDNSDQTHALG